MTVTPGDGPLEAARQRTRDQLNAILAEDPELIVDTETGDLADFNFLCDRQQILVPDQAAADRLDAYFGNRLTHGDENFEPGARHGLVADKTRAGLALRYRVPLRRAASGTLLDTMGEMDADLRGEGRHGELFSPNHFVHVAPKATCCPATEPAETGLPGPWPAASSDSTAGRGVNVVVVDTGLYKPALAQPWLGNPPTVTGVREHTFDNHGIIRPYAGHGTFVAGVVRSLAPAARVHVLSFQVNATRPSGGVREHELIQRLDQAVQRSATPHLINLSAGTRTRHGRRSKAFERWWDDVKQKHPDLVVVAAAGNDSSSDPFYPASSSWAVGVGSVDHDSHVSSFSNYGPYVDIFALGRNVVNAFPRGRYMGHERPNIGDERRFTKMLARWSGTSFAAPVVTGLIAAEMSRHPLSGARAARDARDAVLHQGHRVQGPSSTQVTVLSPPYDRPPPYT